MRRLRITMAAAAQKLGAATLAHDPAKCERFGHRIVRII